MNRLFFFCAALLLQVVLFSCKEEVDTTETAGNAVGFSVSPISRAAELEESGLKASGFRVSAYSTDLTSWTSAKATATPGFMYSQSVTWSTDKWTYSDVKYWPGKVDGSNYGKLSFFAWSKDAESIASVSLNTKQGAPTLSVTVPDDQADQKDLVTGVVVDETSQTVTGGVVPFAFKHVLSRIGFKAKLKEEYPDATVKVISLMVKYKADAVKSKGTYTFGDTDHAAGAWALDGSTYMPNTAGDEVVDADVTLDNTASLTTTPLNGVNNYLMLLPQAVGDGAVVLDIEWTVTATDGAVVTNNQTIELPAQTWVQGEWYDYHLNVSLTAVTFGSVTVNPWNDNVLFAPCTITYKANGGTGADYVEERITNISYPLWDGNTFTTPAANLAFAGWNTQDDGNGANYAASAPFTPTGDLTLYAQWRVPPANCYMVAPGDMVYFSVSRAYVDDGFSDKLRVDEAGSDYTGSFTAETLWDDNSVIDGTPTVNGSGKSAEVTVNTNNNKGNAVIAVKKGSDIVWSWHIWVTDYDGVATYTNNGFTFMDRNLGATQASTGSGLGTGLFYQWGRKDPFPATGDVTTEATSATTGTIVYTLQHPTTFLTTNSSPYDWYYGSSRKNELWGHSGAKTIYDPCPAGWRVPKNSGMSEATSPWYGFNGTWDSNNGGGYTWDTNDLYPAAGGRHQSNGSLTSPGVSGYYWSASPYDSNGILASCQSFSSNNARYGSNYRVVGFSVRCVKE
ncbi:MAG: InlB B-repeat-containing protein [Mediterranea sp.]|jgi:hypothetical protein|nr:InlB B-repeat-containing protein [Mediterranea sp.]